MIENRNAARQLFKDCDFTYADIDGVKLEYLVLLINQKFNAINLHRINAVFGIGDPMYSTIDPVKEQPYWKRAKVTYSKFGSDGSLKVAYIAADGGHFSCREVISFSRNGFIAFACESSDRNTRPVLDAFEEWITWMREIKRREGMGWI